MAWSVVTQNKAQVNGKGQILFDLVFLEDGVERERVGYRLNAPPEAGWLAEQAQLNIDRLEGLRTFFQNLPATVTPQAPATTDPVLVQFRRDAARVQLIANLIALGWVPANHAKVEEVKTRILSSISSYWDQL